MRPLSSGRSDAVACGTTTIRWSTPLRRISIGTSRPALSRRTSIRSVARVTGRDCTAITSSDDRKPARAAAPSGVTDPTVTTPPVSSRPSVRMKSLSSSPAGRPSVARLRLSVSPARWTVSCAGRRSTMASIIRNLSSETALSSRPSRAITRSPSRRPAAAAAVVAGGCPMTAAGSSVPTIPRPAYSPIASKKFASGPAMTIADRLASD